MKLSRNTIIEAPNGNQYQILGISKNNIILQRIDDDNCCVIFTTTLANIERYGYRIKEQDTDGHTS